MRKRERESESERKKVIERDMYKRIRRREKERDLER
jgi:hypothetical protein